MKKVQGLTKEQYTKVREEADSFTLEYGENPDSEVVEEYLRLLDDFTPVMKTVFANHFGY